MSVTLTRQWTGGKARHHHHAMEEVREDTRDFVVRHVGPDDDPQQPEAAPGASPTSTACTSAIERTAASPNRGTPHSRACRTVVAP